MDKVWGNTDLRRLIFSYLRKEAFLKCKTCNVVLEWDPKKEVKQKYLLFYKYVCTKCAYDEIREYRFNCITF